MRRIGEVVAELGISADTLRYYEKIKLSPAIARNVSGIRLYCSKDLSRLKFIKRAQRMGFSLEEIRQLLHFREAPQQAKPEVRQLASEKLADIEIHLKELELLRNEFKLLINLCTGSDCECPILDSFETPESRHE